MNYDAPMRRWKGHMRSRLVLVGIVLAGCGTKSESPPPPTPAPAPVAVPVSADAAPAVDSAALYKAVGERVIKEIDAAYPPLALAPNASTDPYVADIPAVGDCARPDATERAAIEKLLAQAFVHVGCKDPDGIIVAEQFDRMKGTRRDKGVWRVLRVKDKKVTQLGEAVGTPEVDWQEYAQENTINVLVLADVDGDGARDAVLEQTSQEGGAIAHASVLQVVKSTATKAVKLGDFDAVTAVRLALGSRPGALVLGAFPTHADDKKPVYKCVTPTALTDCPAAAQAASAEAKREVAQTFASGTLKPQDRTQLAGYLDTLGVQGDERERLLATVPEAKAP
jgi:hypothetical protein